MIKLLCAASLLIGASALRADVFTFSYTGVTGTLTATALTPGLYTVSSVSGNRNGLKGLTGAGTIVFSLGPLNLLDTMSFVNNNHSEAGLFISGSGSNLSLENQRSRYPPAKNRRPKQAVPEPAAIMLFLAMGLGVWILARKLRLQPR